MAQKKRRLQFGLRTFFFLITLAAFLIWYFTPPPTAEELAERIRNAKSPDEIPALLRQVDHLSGREIQSSLFGSLGAPNPNYDCSRQHFLSDPDLKNLYLGCKQWAEAEPKQVREWIDRELHQKDVSGLDMVDSGVLAVLTGFTEGAGTHGLDNGFSIADGFSWRNDHFDAVVCGLYPEIEKRSVDELMAWVDSFCEHGFYESSMREAVQKRLLREDTELFIKWTEDRMVDKESDLYYVREPGYAFWFLTEVDLDRSVQWIHDLEQRRSDYVAREILGCTGDAYVNVAEKWCERDRYEFIDWAVNRLRQHPTNELYQSWHRAISETVFDWPEEDIQYVEKAVFMLDGGAVNFPAIYWYLDDLPNEKVLELSAQWLGEESLATEEQKNELRKAFGHAIMWFDPEKAKLMFGKLRDETERKIFLAGADRIGKNAGTGWWMRWRHDAGILKTAVWYDDEPQDYEEVAETTQASE